VNGPVICGIDDESVGAVARELAERFGLPVAFVHVLQGGDGDHAASWLWREATVPEHFAQTQAGGPDPEVRAGTVRFGLRHDVT
jgi:hypothetical protein